MHIFQLRELTKATENFSPSQLIGKGSHGSVYKALLEDGNLVAAIKKQSLALHKLGDNTKIENEASILSSIPPNSYLVDLLGTSHDDYGNKIIVTRYMPNGTLHELLHASSTPPSWRKRLEIALQIAKGVLFLHESGPPIVHRDIKSTNILFDEMWSAKLADFGLAVELHSGTWEKLPAGTIGYIDPNYTRPSKLSTKIDVFSFGVVLLELVSGRKVMDVSISPPSIVEWALPLIDRGRTVDVCDKRVRLSRDVARTIEQLLHLAASCLSPNENIRPTMSENVANLENLTAGSIHLPVLRNSFRGSIVSMMWLRKFRFCGMVTASGGTCEDHDRESSLSNNNNSSMSKGTLLVREILADTTLK